MISKLKIFSLLLFIAWAGKAQNGESSNESLQISGSVDTYYKYDFSGNANQPTWFGTDQNSISLGMVNVILSQTKGKVSFVGDLAFGPRGNGDDGSEGSSVTATALGVIQNLYVSYAVNDRLSLTAGFMGTFIGYEVISPTANFNYSGSYLFSNGPFQNSGIKADIALGKNMGLMVGLFSSKWDSYISDPNRGIDNIGTQFSVSPTEGLDIYLNYIVGSLYEQWDLTSGYQLSDDFYLGLNVSQNTKYDGDDTGFFGLAGYAQYALSESVELGIRYESFSWGNYEEGSIQETGPSVGSFTLSANFISGPLTIIPEVRLDSFDKVMDGSSFTEISLLDNADMPTDAFTQFGLAAVYSF